ncbi:MAG: YbjN domain-containing protein [Deltaproteobacteria bacterium]|jgi:hypothetical protein|nr:YbjN domain-containing protein [Deltaproteobacteria bacterium]
MPRKRLKILSLLVIFGIIAILSSKGESFAADDTLYEKISPKELISIIESEGDSAFESGDNVVIWSINDQMAALKISDNNDNVVFLYYNSNLKPTPAKINKWNSQKMYSKSFQDTTGDVFLELDLDFAGGITEANVKNFLRICYTSLDSFSQINNSD